MTRLSDLATLIDENDPQAFLIAYLSLLSQGYTLSIPTETNPNSIKADWEQILARLSRTFEDSFLNKLSTVWFKLIKKHGDPNAPNFALKALALLGISEEDLPTPPKKKAPEKPGVILTGIPEKGPILSRSEGISTQISPDYYHHKEAIQAPEISLEDLSIHTKKAIESDNEHGFLMQHLGIVEHNKTPQVPLSSLLSTIHNYWESYIMKQFNMMPSKVFLHALAGLWFSIVNQKGLPQKEEDYLALYHHVKATYLGPEFKSTPPKKKSFLTRLFTS